MSGGGAKNPVRAVGGTRRTVARPRHLWPVAVLVCAVVVAITALVGFGLLSARREAWSRASESSSNLSLSVRQMLQRTIETYDLSLRAVIDNLAVPGVMDLPPHLRDLILFDRAASAAHLGSIIVLDPVGRVRLSSFPMTPESFDLSDREYFLFHRDNPDPGLNIGRPFRSRINRTLEGSWLVSVSRRLSNADGSFAGVVAGAIRLDSLRKQFEAMSLGSKGSIMLYREDGIVLMRTPYVDAFIGRDLSGADSIRRIMASPDHKPFVETAGLDGVRRFYTPGRVEEYPVYVNIAISVDVVEGEWRTQAAVALALTIFLLSTLVALAVLLRREFLRRTLAETTARRDADMLVTVMASMQQGLIACDDEGRILTANAKYREMFGVGTSEVIQGRPFRALVLDLASRGHYGAGDCEALADARMMLNPKEEGRRTTLATLGNRSIELIGQPLRGGGFVDTFTDISDRLLQEAALRESEARYRLLAESGSDLVLHIGPDSVCRYASPAAQTLLGVPPGDMVGRNLQAELHADDVAGVQAALMRLRDGEASVTMTHRSRRADGSFAWLETTVSSVRHPASGERDGVVAISRDVAPRKAFEERLAALAMEDGLTGIPNRRAFDGALKREWTAAMRDGAEVSVLLIDVDRFKGYNDSYGHQDGDECLRKVAEAIRSVAKRPQDVSARYGGEEFAVLLPRTDEDGAMAVADLVRRAVESLALPHCGSDSAIVTVSIGVATAVPRLRECWSEPEQLLRAADAGLYAAKAAGRNRCVRTVEKKAA